MKNTSKILALVLALMTVLMSLSVLTVNAVAGQTWTVAGVKALCGTDWDTANKNNDMTYDEATDSYVKVYTNVKAGTYQFKCAKDHKWDTAYPGSNYNLKVEKDGSTVTITLKGTTVTAKVEAPACDHKYEVTAATVTCLTAGSRTWTCSVCGDSYTEEKLDALGHYYDESGKCIRCDATTEFVRVYVDNAAKWTEVYCYTWDTNPYVAWPGEKLTLTTEDGLFYYDIPKHFVNVIFNNGGSTQSADLKTPTGTATIYNNSTKAWSAPHVHEFVDGKCECGEEDPNYVPPHVNALVVSDTNKIVVSGETLNDFGLPVEWVPFVADENAFYSFVGDNSALAFIFTAEGALVSATGAANLEAGAYLICLGNGVAGEFNVAVTKSAWVNALAIGDNKILITDAQDNGYGFYISWVPFEVTEKANYTFTGEGLAVLVFDSAFGSVNTTELEVGTYNICVAFATPATTGVATVKVEKTAIEQGGEDGPVEGPTHDGEQKVVLGDNTIVIDGCTSNLSGTAIEWLTFVVEEAGTYVVSSADLNCFIYDESKNLASLDACLCGFTGTAVLEPGTYYLCVGNAGVTGEFTVNIKLDNEAVVHKNTLVVGDNKYIITDALHTAGFELNVTIEITEPGTYVVTGGAPMKVYFWYILGESTGNNFASNMDGFSETGLADSFTVTITEAGTYYMGFNYEYVTDEREFDINISLKEVEDPKPEDPKPEDPKDEEPKDEAPEMNFFQKIIAWFMDLIQKLLAMFKK